MREIEVVADDVEILPLNDELCSTSLRNCALSLWSFVAVLIVSPIIVVLPKVRNLVARTL